MGTASMASRVVSLAPTPSTDPNPGEPAENAVVGAGVAAGSEALISGVPPSAAAGADDGGEESPAGGDSGGPTKPFADKASTGLAAVAAWIPSEALVIYTSVYGLFLTTQDGTASSADNTVTAAIPVLQRWVALGIAGVVGIVLLVFHAKREQKAVDSTQPLSLDKLVLSIVLMLVALGVYVMNLPGDPLTEWFGLGQPWPAVFALAAAAIIPPIGFVLGLRKPQ